MSTSLLAPVSGPPISHAQASQGRKFKCTNGMEGEKDSVVLEGHKIRNVGSTFSVIPRSETWTLKKPKTVSKKLKSGFRVPDLSGMLHTFKGEESQSRSVVVGFFLCVRG